jgi:hypothetical protein
MHVVSLRPTTATATVCSGRITMHRKRLSQKGCTWFHFDLCLNFPQWMDNNAERRWAKNTHTLAHTHTHTYTCRCKPRCQPVAWCAVPQRTKPQGQECKQHPQACCPPPCGCCSSSAVDAAWHMHVAACRGRVCVVTLAIRCCARTGAHGPLLKVGW